MSNKRKAAFTERLYQSGQDKDGAFFDKHPTVTAYERAATLGELRVTGYPPGTVVQVQRIGIQRLRAFVPPNERLN